MNLNFVYTKSHLLLLLTFSIFICSCSKDTNIKGIWIGKQQVSDFEGVYFPLPLVIEISDNKMQCYSLDYYEDEKKRYQKLDIKFVNQQIIIENDTLSYKINESDELEISPIKIKHKRLIFKRAPASNINIGQTFNHKAYCFCKENKKTDTIDFINDTLISSLKDNTSPLEQFFKYKILNYNSLSFISFSASEIPPLLFICQNNNRLFFKECFIYEKSIVLIPLNSKNDISGFIGRWQNQIRTRDDSVLFYKFNNRLSEMQINLNIEIQQDSISFNSKNKEKKYKWQLNNTNDWLYIFNTKDNEITSWKILSKSPSRMVIKKKKSVEYNPLKPEEIFVLYKIN